MITEQTIREAYTHLRKTNNSIPDETLDFMLEASLEKLKEINREPLLPTAIYVQKGCPSMFEKLKPS